MKPILIRLVPIAILAAVPLHGAAAQSFSFGLRPEDQEIGYFQYTLEPGAIHEDALLALNTTEDDILIRVSVVAGHTAMMGGVAFPGEADGAAGWVSLPDEGILEIPAGKQVRLPFTVSIPAGTAPGEYVAGFLASPARMDAEESVGGSMNVNIISQMGLTMIITVPGDHSCGITLNGIHSETSTGSWNLFVSMQNTGNIHFKGVGEFALVSTENSSTAALKNMKIGYFVAGDEMRYPLSFDQAPPPGHYQARLTLLGEDCVYQALFIEDFFIEPDEYHLAEAEALRWDRAEQVYPSTDPDTQQRSVLDQVGLLLIGTALIILVLALLLFLVNSLRGSERGETSDSGFPGPLSTGQSTFLRMQVQKGGEQTNSTMM